MGELIKKLDDKFILIVPISGKPSRFVDVVGDVGYNVMFSTDKLPIDVLDNFSEHLEGSVVTDTHFWKRSYQAPFRLDDEFLDELGNYNGNIWISLFNQRQPKFFAYQFPYERDARDTNPRRAFALNLQSYEDKLMETAYGLSNYPVGEEERQWVRDILARDPEEFC